MFKELKKKVRLLINRNKKPYLFLYKMLGFIPDNIGLYKQALIHKSSTLGKACFRRGDNERMEFLGDAVLSAIVTDFLYRNYRNKSEGFLSTMRSDIVQRETLEQVAVELGLDKMVIFSQERGGVCKHIFGNALEALVGAVYLDQGYEVCAKFVENEIIRKHINLQNLAQEKMNYKSVIIEWGQKNRVGFCYELVESYHNNRKGRSFFRSAVVVGGERIGIGTGTTKRESQQQAAKVALEKINGDKIFREHVFELSRQAKSDADDSAAETSSESPSDPE